MKNPGLQAVAFILAVLLWGFVRVTQEGIGLSTSAQLTLQVPIKLHGTPTGLVPYDISQQEARITLKGDTSSLSQLRDGMVSVWVDLAGIDQNGSETVSVWPDVKVLPAAGMKVVAQDPMAVNVKLSPPQTRLVPVHLRVSGRAANGMSVGEASVDPAKVRLSGPQALLEDVHEVIGQCVLGGQSESFSMQIRDLTPVNSQGTEVQGRLADIRLMPSYVTATIPVQLDSHLVAVPIALDNVHVPIVPGYRFRLELAPEVITLRLSRGQSAPTQLGVHPLAFASGAKVDSHEVSVVVPDGMEVVGNTTVTVKMIPEKMDTATP